MTDYFSQLVMRVQEAAPILEPRVPSYYEDTPQPAAEALAEAAEWKPATAINKRPYHSVLAPVVSAPIEAAQPALLRRDEPLLPNLAEPTRTDVTDERSIRPEPEKRVQLDGNLLSQPAMRFAPEGALQPAIPPLLQLHWPEPVVAKLDEIRSDGHLTEENGPAPKPQVSLAQDLNNVATLPIGLLETVTRVHAEPPPIEPSRQNEGPAQAIRAPFGLDLAPSTRPVVRVESATRVPVEKPPIQPPPRKETPVPLLNPAHPVFNPLPPSDRGERGSAPIKATGRTIHVTIGRVEIRAMTAPPLPARAAKSTPNAMGLQDYLKQRHRGPA